MKSYILLAVFLMMMPMAAMAATNDPTALHDRGNQKLIGNLTVSGEVKANSSTVSALTASDSVSTDSLITDIISAGSISSSSLHLIDDQMTEGNGFFSAIGVGFYMSGSTPKYDHLYYLKRSNSPEYNLTISHQKKQQYGSALEETTLISITPDGKTIIDGYLSASGIIKGAIKQVTNAVVFTFNDHNGNISEFLENNAVLFDQWFNNNSYTYLYSAPLLFIFSDGITGDYGSCSNPLVSQFSSCANRYDVYKDDILKPKKFCSNESNSPDDVGTFAVRNNGTLLYCSEKENIIAYVPAAQTSSTSSAVSFGSADYNITSGTANTNNLAVQNRLQIPVINSSDITAYCMQSSDGTFGFNVHDNKLFVCYGDEPFVFSAN